MVQGFETCELADIVGCGTIKETTGEWCTGQFFYGVYKRFESICFRRFAVVPMEYVIGVVVGPPVQTMRFDAMVRGLECASCGEIVGFLIGEDAYFDIFAEMWAPRNAALIGNDGCTCRICAGVADSDDVDSDAADLGDSSSDESEH